MGASNLWPWFYAFLSAQSAGLDCQTSHVWFYNFFTRQARICYDPHPQTLQAIRQDQTKHKPMNLGIFLENISIHSLDNKILFHTIYSATKLISFSKTTKRRWLCYLNGIYFVFYYSTLMLILQGRVVWKSCTALALTCHPLLEKILLTILSYTYIILTWWKHCYFQFFTYLNH